MFTWGFWEYWALGTGDCANQWIPVQVSENVEDISCGARHSGIISKNSVFMCGEGNAGQLGTGKRQKETRFVKIDYPYLSMFCTHNTRLIINKSF